ncbi:MAG: hypothetical protein A2061_10700 [Gallionellales bacterium GWA2_59_43]|nr:MAG: hypothetical protein A2061_10700 [Gallionellales bacterium GWA2_59_43]
MKSKLLTSLILAMLAVPGVAIAADVETTEHKEGKHVVPESAHTVTANVGFTTDYLFRGISQSSHDPAIQGGFDYAHSSGFYLGVWGSSVGWIRDYQGYTSGSTEFDLYGGFRGGFEGTDITYDLGAVQYYYPGSRAAATTNADTTELYAGLGWKWFAAKYSYVASNGAFGFANADGSDYLDISASLPIGDTGLTAGAHWGTFSFKNNGAQDYDDWKISLSYDLGSGMTVGAAYSDTNANNAVWTDTPGNKLGEGQAFAWVSKAF